MAHLTFRDDDGCDIAYRHWPASPAARAVVVIVHGASEHSGRYARVAGVVNEAGCAAYAMDLRGHGLTAASTGPGRIGPRGMAGVLDDILTLIRRARAEHGAVPVVLFGHSMGSVIVQRFVEEHGDAVGAYVLSGSMGAVPNATEFAEAIRSAVEAGMADEPLDTFADFGEQFEAARTPYDWLSRDDDEVDRYIADPLCGDDNPLTYGFVAAMLGMVAEAMEPEQIALVPTTLPVLLLTGEADVVSNGGEYVRELEERLRAAGLEVTAHYYADARHEVLNEVNREDVHRDLLDWLHQLALSD